MYLIYYIEPTSKERLWIKSTNEEGVKKYVSENNIQEYYVTVDESEHARMKHRITLLEQNIDSIKKFIDDISKK